MDRPVVLLAVPMREDRGRIAREALGDRAEVLVRSDLDDAEIARRGPEVDVLVTGGFPRDIPADLWPRMGRLRLLQTVAAGVDHLPYDRIPARVTICSNPGAHRGSIAEHPRALPPAAAKNRGRQTEAAPGGAVPPGPRGR